MAAPKVSKVKRAVDKAGPQAVLKESAEGKLEDKDCDYCDAGCNDGCKSGCFGGGK